MKWEMDKDRLKMLMDYTRENQLKFPLKTTCTIHEDEDIKIPMDFDEVTYRDDDDAILIMAAGIAAAFDVNVAGAIMGAAILSGD